MRGFYAMPLIDDTGRVGVLALESSDPDFLGSAHIEILQVLSSQATVALRNAQMYKEVPFISVLEPIQENFREWAADPAAVAKVLRDGAERADEVARRTLARAYEAIGLVLPGSAG